MLAALIVGIVTAVHDGDTFSIGKQRIRVFGIDAPELHQMCAARADASSCAPCGETARRALSAMILGKEVRCTDRGRSYDRVVGECTVGGRGDRPRNAGGRPGGGLPAVPAQGGRRLPYRGEAGPSGRRRALEREMGAACRLAEASGAVGVRGVTRIPGAAVCFDNRRGV
jgi:hypothetical protein